MLKNVCSLKAPTIQLLYIISVAFPDFFQTLAFVLWRLLLLLLRYQLTSA
jgi:hypothetical protein